MREGSIWTGFICVKMAANFLSGLATSRFLRKTVAHDDSELRQRVLCRESKRHSTEVYMTCTCWLRGMQ
jgi:hypothetical protein